MAGGGGGGGIAPAESDADTAGVVNLTPISGCTCCRHTRAETGAGIPSGEVIKCHVFRLNRLKGDGRSGDCTFSPDCELVSCPLARCE